MHRYWIFPNHPDMMNDHRWTVHPLAIALLVVLVAAICVGAVALYRYVSRGSLHAGAGSAPTNAPASSVAEDVLRMRLASGEIDEADFRSRLRALRGDSPAVG